jgi:glycolate oxidase
MLGIEKGSQAKTKSMLHQALIDRLIAVCGQKYVLANAPETERYESDQSVLPGFPFDCLVKPASADEISAIVTACGYYGIAVTPRGGGSGVVGGALPVMGGVVLSLERLNSIREINKDGGFVLAEAGVITEDLCNAVERENFWFPTGPSSKSMSFIGGNVAQNSGSINSCKYGTVGQYVLNLEVVLPTGEIMWTGANVKKCSTGLNLTQLFVGSEGTLGVITKVVLKILPPVGFRISLLAGFSDLEKACSAVWAIRRTSVIPSAVEMICKNAIILTSDFLKCKLPLIKKDIEAHLLIEIEDSDEDILIKHRDTLFTVLEGHTSADILVAGSTSEKCELWKLRMNIGNAMVAGRRKYRDIDLCIPLSFLYSYIKAVEDIGCKHDIPVICFGHALDGNIHTMIQIKDEENSSNIDRVELVVNEIYAYGIANGGVISGEHGIGFLQRKFMSLQFTPAHLRIMRELKGVFDPRGILNPGKMLDDK